MNTTGCIDYLDYTKRTKNIQQIDNVLARPLRRAVQNQLEDKLAEAILDGNITRGSEVIAGISKKEIKFEVKTTKDKQ